ISRACRSSCTQSKRHGRICSSKSPTSRQWVAPARRGVDRHRSRCAWISLPLHIGESGHEAGFMRRGSSRIQNAALLLLCGIVAALGLVNWRMMELEAMPQLVTAGDAPAEPPVAPVSSPRPVDHDPLSAFDEMVRRPLFTATRSPFVPTQSTPNLAGPPDIRLTGVAIDASKKRALLRSSQQP